MVLAIDNKSMNLTTSPRTQTDFISGTALPFTKNFKKISKIEQNGTSKTSQRLFSDERHFNLTCLSSHAERVQERRRHMTAIKGRVSRFSACASDDLSAVKIIVFKPSRSAFTTLAGYRGKLL